MTEEEKKSQQEQSDKANGTNTNSGGSDNAGANKANGGNNEDVRKSQDTPAWKAAADGMRKRAESLRQYSQEPVETDTEGQRDYIHEFITSRLARQQETDEERERREKRERTGRRLSALADGLIALSNVTGAMFGGTPLKQTSLSAAHRKSVQEAVERRKENAKQYETARRHAVELQQKQDEAAAKRRDGETKARREAAKQADNLEVQAARLELQGGNADRTYQLAKDRAEQTAMHQGITEKQGAQRIALARNKETRLSGGGWSSKPTYDTIRTTKVNDDGSKTVTTKHVPMSRSKVKVKGSKKGGGYAGKFK